MFKPRSLFLIGMILLAAATRLLPHAPNFTPIAAIALFGGAFFRDKRLAILVPFAALFLSDLILGFHTQVFSVYLSFFLILLLGFKLRENQKILPVARMTLMSSVLFFVITNFGVWLLDGLYPRTVAGLIDCYAMAIPFFHQTVMGDALYVVGLFGGFALAQRLIESVREPVVL
ncbi:MAG: hypothetical protein Q7S00_01540 [bacterium]|nr:hypothetical protein [bacterium]